MALAVSGGGDSMALMHLVARWLRLHPQKAHVGTTQATAAGGRGSGATQHHAASERHGWINAMGGDIARLPQAIVLTVDHGLRADSAREAALVEEAARRLGLPCVVLRWQGDKPVTGVQDAARTARRALMRDVIVTEPDAVEAACGVRSLLRVLVMAHHLEDQAETVLMRLGRGSGLDGLKGMAADAADTERPGDATGGEAVRIMRPLLATSKQRLVDTLRANGITWVEDPSNADERFERVRIRKAVETLAGVGIGPEMIALSARRLADAAAWIDAAAREPHAGAGESGRFVHDIDWHAGVYAELALPGTPTFDVPRYAAVRTVRQVLRSFGGEGREPELQQLETVVEIVRSNYAALPEGLTLGGCRLVFAKRRGGGRTLQVFREGAGLHSAAAACRPGQVVSWDGGRFLITADPAAPPATEVRALGSQGWASLKRQLPALAGLGWPAAAAATLPVIVAGDDIVAHPGLDAALQAETRPGDELRAAWAGIACPEARCFTAQFQRMPW